MAEDRPIVSARIAKPGSTPLPSNSNNPFLPEPIDLKGDFGLAAPLTVTVGWTTRSEYGLRIYGQIENSQPAQSEQQPDLARAFERAKIAIETRIDKPEIPSGEKVTFQPGDVTVEAFDGYFFRARENRPQNITGKLELLPGGMR